MGCADEDGTERGSGWLIEIRSKFYIVDWDLDEFGCVAACFSGKT